MMVESSPLYIRTSLYLPRNQQAARAVRNALANPRTPSFKLIECEFPPINNQNKLGDGSLRSAQLVDDANLEAAKAILLGASGAPLSSLLGGGPAVWLLTSSTATRSFQDKAAARVATDPKFLHCLRDGLPAPVKSRDVCVLVAPASGPDFTAAQRLAANGNAVIVVNALAKDRSSMPGGATMAYFLKPLTYNSQIAGYLIRAYPGPWTTVDATTGMVLGTFTDAEILVPNTNTPDLRAAVRQVQKAVDARVILQRQNAQRW
jgi:Domain of unknown function (DUF1995)